MPPFPAFTILCAHFGHCAFAPLLQLAKKCILKVHYCHGCCSFAFGIKVDPILCSWRNLWPHLVISLRPFWHVYDPICSTAEDDDHPSSVSFSHSSCRLSSPMALSYTTRKSLHLRPKSIIPIWSDFLSKPNFEDLDLLWSWMELNIMRLISRVLVWSLNYQYFESPRF